MDINYQIQGGTPLQGDVTISGSKNAALPLIAASLLCTGETVLTNVPNLRDIRVMLEILEYLGAETSFEDGTVRIRAQKVQSKPIPSRFVGKLRGSIVLLAPLLARFGVAQMDYPGGCVLGKRPVDAHIRAFEQLGAVDMSTENVLHLQGNLKPGHIVLPEFSVTATENALIAAAALDGESTVELAAEEPHVQDVCAFLKTMGANIERSGAHSFSVTGAKDLKCSEHKVVSDYLEVGAFAIATIVTKGKVRLHNVEIQHVTAFLDVLRRMGAVWSYDEDKKILFIDGEISSLKAARAQSNIFPGLPTDLLPLVGVAMTQAQGVSRIFEVLFEGRMAYLYELEKMGAHIEVLNSHQALIIGPTPLRGRSVASNDIRAGAAMVAAGLSADGTTTVTDVQYIERGYDHFDQKLRSLGAKIEKIQTGDDPESAAKEVTKKNVKKSVKEEKLQTA